MPPRIQGSKLVTATAGLWRFADIRSAFEVWPTWHGRKESRVPAMDPPGLIRPRRAHKAQAQDAKTDPGRAGAHCATVRAHAVLQRANLRYDDTCRWRRPELDSWTTIASPRAGCAKYDPVWPTLASEAGQPALSRVSLGPRQTAHSRAKERLKAA